MHALPQCAKTQLAQPVLLIFYGGSCLSIGSYTPELHGMVIESIQLQFEGLIYLTDVLYNNLDT